MKKLSLVLALVCFAVTFAMAQRTVSGTVTDESGETLIGASILVKGTSTGTVTDIDGNYSLTVPEGSNTLVISYTGYATQEIDVTGQTGVNITMAESAAQLNEVVVTGLGIRKEKKALGYAVTTINADDFAVQPEADVSRILRGRAPGVDIQSTSGIAGSGTNVIIRGYSSISGTNQPLFVVDGVPFNSDTNSDRTFVQGGATSSSRFLDLDPNNIAEVSILKGLSATVLYGEAGRNGVVLITTKNGSTAPLNKKFEVTLNQSVFLTEAASVPDVQNQYGNGWQNFASAAFSNWGAPFDQPGKNGIDADGTINHPYNRAALATALPQYQGARYDYQAYDNNGQFFRTGTSNNTSIGISTRLDRTSLNFNYSFLGDEGFIPNNDYTKHNFDLGINTQLDNGLKIASTFSFIDSDRNAPPSAPIFSSNPAGANAQSLFSNVLYTPRSVDLFGLEFANPLDGSSIYYRGGNDIQHPLWTLNNTNNNEVLRRFFVTVNTSYDLTDWLSVQYRLGLDSYTQRQRFTVNKGGRQDPNGRMETSERLNFLTDQVLNLNFDRDVSASWNISGVLGANIRRETRDFTFVESTQQFIFDLFEHSNFIDQLSSSFFREENTIGVYLSASAGYKSFLYFNFQARNDWTSTLEPENNSQFYPSASVSFIPTEAFAGLQQSNTLNYLKLRLGYGTSAGYPNPYQTRNVLAAATNQFVTPAGTIINTNSISNRFGNPNLTPEIHRELEAGIEARLFNNRVGIDLSLFDKNSSDLIIDLQLDPSTGFTATTVNAAEITNQGIELGLNIRPIYKQNLFWDVNINFTALETTVNQIADGIDKFLIPRAGYSFLGNYVYPGRPYGVIEGTPIVRDENGNPVINGVGTYDGEAETAIIGDPNPDWNASLINTFTWKNFNFRFQFDYVHGGDIYSSTASTLYARGILAETGFDRFVPVVVDGVDAEGNPNTIQITPNRHFWENAGVFYDENRIFDGTTIRLREVSLSYNFGKNLLANTPFGNLSLTLTGQNLWYRAVNFPDGANFDPEVLSLGVGNGRGFDFATGPTAKRYGVTLRASF